MSSIDGRPKAGASWDPRFLEEQASQSGGVSRADPNAPDNASAPPKAQPGKTQQAGGAGVSRGVVAPGEAAAGAVGGAMPTQEATANAPVGATTTPRFSGANTVLATPPPLPPQRGRVTQETAANYESLMADVGETMKRGLPATTFDAQAFVQQAAQHDTATPQGRQALQAQVNKTVLNGFDHLNSMNDAQMMAAFLELNVRNAASGKELQANLLNLSTQARNNALEASIKEREAQAAALKKAQKKQDALGPLMNLVKAILLVVTAAATALSFGAMSPLLAAAMAATLAGGFVVGGAVKGSKNGKGFDLGGALDGATLAISLFGAGALMKAVALAIKRAVTTVAIKTGAKKAAQTGASNLASATGKQGATATATSIANASKAATQQSVKLEKIGKRARELAEKSKVAVEKAVAKGQNKVGAASSPAPATPATGAFAGVKDTLRGVQSDAAAGVQAYSRSAMIVTPIVSETLQAVVSYRTHKQTLEAKEHEAAAKMYNTMADGAQMQWEGLQSSLQSITDAHNKAVDQAMEMINRQHRTNQKATGNIGR